MPSPRKPNAISIGPGKLASQTAIATVQMFPSSSSSGGSAETATVVVTVTDSTTLTQARNLLALVSTSHGDWTTGDTVTLPAGASIGDRVTVTDVDGNAATDNITVDASGLIDGQASVVVDTNDGSVVCLHTGSNNWVVEAKLSTPVPIIVVTNVTDSIALSRVGPNQIVAVETSHANWTTGDTITLPSDAQLGDQISVVDFGGQGGTANIAIATGGSFTMAGLTSVLLTKDYASITFMLTSGLVWTAVGGQGMGSRVVVGTTVMTRRFPLEVVLVGTNTGWLNGNTITLPSDAQIGDKICVKDVDGNGAVNAITVSPGASTNNGVVANSISIQDYGRIDFEYVASGAWVRVFQGITYRMDVNNTTTLIQDYGYNQALTVDTSHANWTSSDTITLDNTPTPFTAIGTLISIADVGGNASTDDITIQATGGTIDGQASITISDDYGAVILRLAGANMWVTLARPKALPSTQLVQASGPTNITPTRSRHLVQVDTSHASWVTSGTVNLPSGDLGTQITVVDTGGNASTEPITIDADGGVVNGLGDTVIDQDYGYLVLRKTSQGWLITSSTNPNSSAARQELAIKMTGLTEAYSEGFVSAAPNGSNATVSGGDQFTVHSESTGGSGIVIPSGLPFVDYNLDAALYGGLSVVLDDDTISRVDNNTNDVIQFYGILGPTQQNTTASGGPDEPAQLEQFNNNRIWAKETLTSSNWWWSDDSGVNWTDTGFDSGHRIAAHDSVVITATGSNTYTSINNGTSFAGAVSSTISGNAIGLIYDDYHEVFMLVTDDGRAAISSDDGSSWTEVEQPAISTENDYDSDRRNRMIVYLGEGVVAVSMNGPGTSAVLSITADAGAFWAVVGAVDGTQRFSTPDYYYNIHASNGYLYVVGDGETYRSVVSVYG